MNFKLEGLANLIGSPFLLKHAQKIDLILFCLLANLISGQFVIIHIKEKLCL